METEQTKMYPVKMPIALREKAGKKAKSLGMSFTAYVRMLLIQNS